MASLPEGDQDLQATTAQAGARDWDPGGLGMPQALGLAVLMVAAIVGFLLWAWLQSIPPAVPQAIQVTQATLTQLPKPTPPPPPKVIPPPKPLPAIIPKPAPVQSKIVVATKPPPPIRHIYKPIPHPVINHTPPPPVPVPVTQAPQPPAPPTSGIPVYGQQMYSIIQANQNVPPALAQLGVSGTAIIEIIVAPDGHVISAKIYKSSGIDIIDQTALQHAEQASLPAFNDQMPDTPHAFLIPIEIQPNPNQ
jgi:protein TonB